MEINKMNSLKKFKAQNGCFLKITKILSQKLN